VATIATSADVPLTSPFDCWYRHFCQNRDGPCTLPWHDAYRLSAAERRIVTRSIQQFQLGEWARGRGLMRRASSHSVFATDSRFLPALELFIAEEQGHSRILGQFLDREGIPRLTNHWLDKIFRRLRKLAGLEVCATVLVTAEVLAIPFYQALRDATHSPLLRSICMRILCDEAAHLNYQALTLGFIHRPLAGGTRAIRIRLHSIFFHCTAALLWQQHHRLFRVAGWDSHRFWNESHRLFERLQLRIRQASRHPGGVNLSGDLLLD
jgi:hypothetical protein